MTATPLKIAISGPVGTGKTTLARALGKRLGLPVLEEDLWEVVAVWKAFQALAKTGHAGKPELTRAFRKSVDSYFEWIERRSENSRGLDGFVADRWEADLASFWLRSFSHRTVADGKTQGIMQAVRKRGAELDLVVVLPAGISGFPSYNDDGLKRTDNLCARIMGGSIMTGLTKQLTECPVMLIPDMPLSAEERVTLVEQWLAGKRPESRTP